MRRRDLLARVAAASTPLLAGCLGGGGGDGGDGMQTETPSPSPTATPTPTPTASPTPTEEPGTPTATPTPTPSPDALVKATGTDVFDPTRVSVDPGDTVVWENTATGAYSSHTVTAAQFHQKAADWEMDVKFASGETVSHTFESAGVYEYYCTIHGKSSMCGVVLVGDVSLDKNLPCE